MWNRSAQLLEAVVDIISRKQIGKNQIQRLLRKTKAIIQKLRPTEPRVNVIITATKKS